MLNFCRLDRSSRGRYTYGFIFHQIGRDDVRVEPLGPRSLAEEHRNKKSNLELIVKRQPKAQKKVTKVFSGREERKANPVHEPLSKQIPLISFDGLKSAVGWIQLAEGDAKIRLGSKDSVCERILRERERNGCR